MDWTDEERRLGVLEAPRTRALPTATLPGEPVGHVLVCGTEGGPYFRLFAWDAEAGAWVQKFRNLSGDQAAAKMWKAIAAGYDATMRSDAPDLEGAGLDAADELPANTTSVRLWGAGAISELPEKWAVVHLEPHRGRAVILDRFPFAAVRDKAQDAILTAEGARAERRARGQRGSHVPPRMVGQGEDVFIFRHRRPITDFIPPGILDERTPSQVAADLAQEAAAARKAGRAADAADAAASAWRRGMAGDEAAAGEADALRRRQAREAERLEARPGMLERLGARVRDDTPDERTQQQRRLAREADRRAAAQEFMQRLSGEGVNNGASS